MSHILWEPSSEAISQSNMTAFIHYINARHQQNIENYPQLYQWSIENPAAFWASITDFCGAIASQSADNVMEPSDNMQHTKWFNGAKLNFAENLLRRRDQHLAIIFASERGDYRPITYQQLFLETAAVATYLQSLDVGPGDRVVGFLPNVPETVIEPLGRCARLCWHTSPPVVEL